MPSGEQTSFGFFFRFLTLTPHCMNIPVLPARGRRPCFAAGVDDVKDSIQALPTCSIPACPTAEAVSFSREDVCHSTAGYSCRLFS